MKPTIQVRRVEPVVTETEAAELLTQTVSAAHSLTPLDSVLWNYGDHRGEQGFDALRALKEAETYGADGKFLAWTLRAASVNKTIEIAMTLQARTPRSGWTCVFTLKPPSGEFSPNQLAESCAALMAAFKAEKAIVWTDAGTVLETCADWTTSDISIIRHGDYVFRAATALLT